MSLARRLAVMAPTKSRSNRRARLFNIEANPMAESSADSDDDINSRQWRGRMACVIYRGVHHRRCHQIATIRP